MNSGSLTDTLRTVASSVLLALTPRPRRRSTWQPVTVGERSAGWWQTR